MSAPVRRLALLWDPPDEGWHSMDLVGEFLSKHLRLEHVNNLAVSDIRPSLPRLARRLRVGASRTLLNVDRLLGRLGTYPFSTWRLREDFDTFHIVDHSYAHLAHVLPHERVGVYCHDLNAFGCLLEPQKYPRPTWFRQLARITLTGLRRSAVVFTSTAAMEKKLGLLGIPQSGRVVCAPYGVADEFQPRVPLEILPEHVIQALQGRRYLLHVGQGIPRKRLDVLFNVFAELKRVEPDLLLVQQGAILTEAQRDQLQKLGIMHSLLQPPQLSRSQLAALYGSSALTLLTSEDEGFGLPIIEALACGGQVLASDIPTVREAGGEAVTYCLVGDIGSWVQTSLALLKGQSRANTEARQVQLLRYRWSEHARIISETYQQLGL